MLPSRTIVQRNSMLGDRLAERSGRGGPSWGNTHVIIRVGSMAAVALTCAACANEPQPRYLGMRANAFRTGALDPVSPAGVEPAEPAKKSLAAKMLTAIALEKVTGLKPDPARFAELD
jgi:hypothetical protein